MSAPEDRAVWREVADRQGGTSAQGWPPIVLTLLADLEAEEQRAARFAERLAAASPAITPALSEIARERDSFSGALVRIREQVLDSWQADGAASITKAQAAAAVLAALAEPTPESEAGAS